MEPLWVTKGLAIFGITQRAIFDRKVTYERLGEGGCAFDELHIQDTASHSALKALEVALKSLRRLAHTPFCVAQMGAGEENGCPKWKPGKWKTELYSCGTLVF